ncbi:unnamed protein product [Mortierella alpina]
MLLMDASQQQPVTDTATAISRDITKTVTGAITRATVVDIPLLTDIAEQRLTSLDIYRGTLSHQRSATRDLSTSGVLQGFDHSQHGDTSVRLPSSSRPCVVMARPLARSLRIHQCTRLSSQELNLILSSCRRLKTLYAMAGNYFPGWLISRASPILDIKNMLMVPEEPGWVCKDMETLEISYSGMDTSIGIPEVLWRQIGQLSKLKGLRIYRHPPSEKWAVLEKESVRQAVSSWVA